MHHSTSEHRLIAATHARCQAKHIGAAHSISCTSGDKSVNCMSSHGASMKVGTLLPRCGRTPKTAAQGAHGLQLSNLPKVAGVAQHDFQRYTSTFCMGPTAHTFGNGVGVPRLMTHGRKVATSTVCSVGLVRCKSHVRVMIMQLYMHNMCM